MESSMLESDFDNDSSDGYSPEPKAPKARAPSQKPAASLKTAPKAKPAPKKLTQTTLKPKAPKKRAIEESDDENSAGDRASDNDDSLLSLNSDDTPPKAKKSKMAAVPKKSSGKPLQPVTNESFGVDGADDVPAPKPKKKAASSTEQYQKARTRPQFEIDADTWTVDTARAHSQKTRHLHRLRRTHHQPNVGLQLRVQFDGVSRSQLRARSLQDPGRDPGQRCRQQEAYQSRCMRYAAEMVPESPADVLQKEKIFIPEMIFGHLLTSSNYDDEEAKVTGGRNGYGAKLCNVYSTKFILETADSKKKQKYKQVWTANMSKMEKAKISEHKGSDYTMITFYPDFAKFGMTEIDTDFEALVKKRVYDMAGTVKGVKVYLNGDRIKVSSFKKYMEIYTSSIRKEAGADGEASKDANVILTDNPNERWEIGFAVSDGSPQQVSFVNSVATTAGGTHVNYIADQIIDKLTDIVKKKNKGGVILKKAQIRNFLFLFVNCKIVNPAFTSQTKEQLTTKPSQFGSKCTLSDKFLKDIAKTEAVNNIIHFAQKKADQQLSKSDGGKRTRMNNSKLTDANKAGTKDGYKCTLILTEGDSASLLALAGRAVLDPDLIGVFPLRGKLLNVRDASIDQITKNAEIQNIKKFMGLQHKKHYDDTRSLRYGSLMIMTDQDHDGSHIKGLLINFFECSFPSLLKIPGFLKQFITPIVKVWKGDPKNPKRLQSFFTMPEYEAWKELPGNERGWDHKYYKGLGTSDAADAEVYFRDLDQHLKEFHVMRSNESELIDLAFSKKKADARKEWLGGFVPGTYLDMSQNEITYDEFINKELILFSMADNLRSIPSVIDGFKPGQRKVLYTCFRRNLKKDVKVVDLAGSVSGLTAYAYGDTSMQQTIVGLAQTFVGSNNVNCLEPSGNFGSRLQGGSDCASARYIYTRLSPFARRVFNASDEPLLAYNTDDGKTIEPECYVPILPMILVNGCDGIGTGWSSTIPNYNPVDIVNNLKSRMAKGATKDDMKPMMPWFRGWKGETEDIGDSRFRFTGAIRETDDNTVEVTELPVRLWTQDFKDRLENIINAEKIPSFIKDYTEYNTPVRVHFIIKLEEKHMKLALEKGLVEAFRLSKTMATTNLVAFDRHGRIHKYATVLDIMEEFYHVRLDLYSKRKAYMLGEMQKELEKLSNQARFVKMIIDGELIVAKKKKAALVAELLARHFKPIPKIADAKKEGEFEMVVEEEESEEDKVPGANDFDYLLGMAIWSLTQERIDRLMKQIGDKETEIDTLIRESPTDLWTHDLDEFLNEWHFQLDDDAKRAKKIANMGRRASQKLGLGAKKGASKKRKADDSDDESSFEAAPRKKQAKKEPSTLTSYFTAPKEKAEEPKKAAPVKKAINAIEQKPVVKPAAAAGLKALAESSVEGEDIDMIDAPIAKHTTQGKKKSLDSDDEDDDVVARVARLKPQASVEPEAGRGGRAASRKPVSYADLDADSDSDGEHLLGDVSNMVKGLPGSTTTKPLFSNTVSRPTSSHGRPSTAKSSRSLAELDEEIDETDYKSLVPKDSPHKPAAKSARDTILVDDEDDSFAVVQPKAALKVPASKPAKAKVAPAQIKKSDVPKPARASSAAPKSQLPPAPKVMSPAAKAYAAKQARSLAQNTTASAVIKRSAPAPSKKSKAQSDSESEDVDALANEILSDGDDSDVPAKKPAARPPRRAAAASTAAKYVVDDDEEDESVVVEEEESFFDAEED
ncbi:hypothetical protein MRB53_037118 [Persea americana]|nr:hypothetical protein MRB53_037118 [Persea americana]